MYKFDFTKDEYEKIIDKCMLNDELAKILEYRIKDYSRTEILMKLQDDNYFMSERTLDRKIKKIINKIKKIL